MANGRKAVARQGGSAFTTIWWSGPGVDSTPLPIAFCQQISHTSPSAVAQPVAVQPLDAIYPVEIATAQAIGHGQLTLTLIEVWNNPIWDRLIPGHQNDLAQVLKTMADSADDMFVRTVITPPASTGNAANDSYNIEYHGCVIADIRDDETIDVTTMLLNKTVEIWYRRAIWSGRKSLDDTNQTGGGTQPRSRL